jgi:hypothetical protein
MEVIVYAAYLIGFLSVFSALVVFAFASLPANVLKRGANAGRFAGLGVVEAGMTGTPGKGTRLTTYDVPKAHAA